MHSSFNVSNRMPHLFARYIAGQITERAWRAFTEVMDSLESAAEERVALADFFHDAIEELGLDAVKLPRRQEAEEVVAAVRR